MVVGRSRERREPVSPIRQSDLWIAAILLFVWTLYGVTAEESSTRKIGNQMGESITFPNKRNVKRERRSETCKKLNFTRKRGSSPFPRHTPQAGGSAPVKTAGGTCTTGAGTPAR